MGIKKGDAFIFKTVEGLVLVVADNVERDEVTMLTMYKPPSVDPLRMTYAPGQGLKRRDLKPMSQADFEALLAPGKLDAEAVEKAFNTTKVHRAGT